MTVVDIQPWLFPVEPMEGESLSHFLGRFRRANELTPTGLGRVIGLGAAIARWEKFRFNPPPSQPQLEALAVVVRLGADRFVQMLPPIGVEMNHKPIRLCGACYGESACHRIEWQLKVTDRCDLHQLRLLSECPNCGARFASPALWVEGVCQRCFITFAVMRNYQKQVNTAV